MVTIGIDFGTTNSIVYQYIKGDVKVISIAGQRTTPSVLYYDTKTENFLVGYQAKQRIPLNPDMAVVNNKRFIGDINKQYLLGNKILNPVEVASLILKYLIEEASKTIGEKINDVVITVPAYFDSVQNMNTKKAAESIGLNVLELLKEPVAASIYYGYDQRKEQTLLIYDFGGGTFDVSILKVKGNDFSVLGIGGNNHLGGADFDYLIAQEIILTLRNEYPDFEPNGKDLKQIEEVAEKLKMSLSTSHMAEDQVSLSGGRYQTFFQIDRQRFNNLIKDKVNDSIREAISVVQKAKIDKDDINRVILVGGTTKIPLIKEMITQQFKEPYVAQNVDEIVAAGAALKAVSTPVVEIDGKVLPVLNININLITAFDLGVRASKNGNRDYFSIIIPEQTKIPSSIVRNYTTEFDGQTSVSIGVFQGNNTDNCSTGNAKFIGGFVLAELPPKKKGKLEIEVKFTLNNNDILEVEAGYQGGQSRLININVKETMKYKDVFKRQKTYIYFLIDVSGSMSGDPIRQVRSALGNYISLKKETDDLVGLAVFGSKGANVFDFSNDFDAMNAKIDTIDVACYGAGGATYMKKGLEFLLPKMSALPSDGNRRQIIILSDGYSYGKTPKKLVPDFNQLGVAIHTVGAGKSYDKNLLEYLSSNTGGIFVAANDISKLSDAFALLAEY